MYIFGAFLIFTAVRLMRGGDEETAPREEPGPAAVPALRARSPRSTSARSFFVRQDGTLYATPLLMVLVVIEATDVVFAVDSIPAVFGVTSDVFIVYTSNIFAVLGLRALCFLVASVVRRLTYLRPALALVLAFVGGKMLLADRFRIPNWISLVVIAGLIGGAAAISLLASRKDPTSPCALRGGTDPPLELTECFPSSRLRRRRASPTSLSKEAGMWRGKGWVSRCWCRRSGAAARIHPRRPEDRCPPERMIWPAIPASARDGRGRRCRGYRWRERGRWRGGRRRARVPAGRAAAPPARAIRSRAAPER